MMMKANKIIYYLEKDSEGKWAFGHSIAVFAKDQEDLTAQMLEMQATGKKLMGVANAVNEYNHKHIIG